MKKGIAMDFTAFLILALVVLIILLAIVYLLSGRTNDASAFIFPRLFS